MADVMKEDDEDGEELVIVEEQPEADEDEEDERVAQDDEGDEEEEDRETIRERRRREKIERKQRRDEAIKRDKLEMDFLRKRNEDLERRLTAQEQRSHQADLSSLDAQIAQAAKEADMADKVIAKAVAAGNGDDVTQAMRYRDQALARINALNARKQQAQQMPAKQPQVDERMLHHAQEFIRENPWYDVQGRNEDSKIVIAIDQTLIGEGFDPTSPDYWSELRKRAAKRLPERFGREKKEGRTPRGGPAVGSGREHAPASTRKEVYISPERKAALIEAGVWDDPTLRQRYVQRYAEYDRQNRS